MEFFHVTWKQLISKKKFDFNYSIHITFKNPEFWSKGKTMFQQALVTQHCLLRTFKLKERDREKG